MNTRKFLCKSFCRTSISRALFPLFLVSLIGGIQACHAQNQTASEPSLICVDPLQKVFRGATDLQPAEPEAHVAVGEFATIQFVFRSPAAVADLKATVSGDVPGAVARFVCYVKVGRSYGVAPADVL